MKFISIIVPNFNNEKYLDDCLSPFLKLPNELKSQIEVIVVDDKSTDNSLSVIEKYVNLDNELFKLIAKKINAHHGSALNAGLKVAKGKWISFLDADDYYNVNVFDQVFDYLNNTIADSVNFGTNILFDQPNFTKTEDKSEEKSSLNFFKYCFVPLSGTFFKLSLVTDMVIPEKYMFDDIYSDSYIWNKAKKIDFNHDIKFFVYRLNRKGQSVGDIWSNYRNTLKIHLYMAYKCITEISEDYYLRWHMNEMIKTCLVYCGCPRAYFSKEKKLIDFINKNVDKLNDEVDYEIVAKNIVKYVLDAQAPDLIKTKSKLIDFDKAIKSL